MTYQEFLLNKSQSDNCFGFDPVWMPDFLRDFQRYLVEWEIRKGRAAIFADCGLGKTPMQLVVAENVIRKTNKPALVITPLSVSYQTEREAEKFGIEAKVSRDGKVHPNITITNYERLHYFNPDDFSSVGCDESSCIKNSDSKTRSIVTEFLRERPYRSLYTATAAPNDYIELGTSSEALGGFGYQDMLGRFFKEQTEKDYLGWGRTKYRLKGHAEIPFWRWVCSWARAVRKPSDLGFDDGEFVLPLLTVNETVIKCSRPIGDMMFVVPAETLDEQREERRATLDERCECAARMIIENGQSAIAWCHLNDEGDLLERLIPGCIQVSGNDSDDEKEEKLIAFTSGQVKVMVTKPVIASWGLNLQHCNYMTMFVSHSFEQFYQSVRRCWRFGQKRPVTVEVISTEGEHAVLENLNRKAAQADAMFTNLVAEMNNSIKIERSNPFTRKEELPEWLATNKFSTNGTHSTMEIAARS